MAKKKRCDKELKLENLLVLNIVIFSVVAIMHFIRLILRTPVFIGNYELPLWISGLGVLVLAFILWQNWLKTKKTKRTCAKILAGIFVVDLLGVLGAWYYSIEFFGFTGTTYAITAIIDATIVIGLLWYIKKK